ncbi:AfsR/SARP family transcriptional regulator [Kutzneria chonburiensis]|uniref:BTAD domain-containing putative transcriptional regulator n=1 Tax=Kutzneria chonburiensis TaxID=1483604 RepID=A0ABV6N6G0_9PSEU|nr:AfsR/SARP family transcriptional regulator [Kutzneria chonburiensis]
MGVQLLGPLELVVDRRPVDIGSPRQRVVLAMLALNANRVTTVDQLIDAVWDDAPPASARSQIQICVSALRKLMSPEFTITTRPPGYLLEIDRAELDSERFTRKVAAAKQLAEDGELTEAADALRAALALWRGPALAGVDSDVVQRDAARLQERKLLAEEERLRIELALGRHEQITGELKALIDDQPFRERPYAFLMLALYRAGRQTEALEVGRRVRATLIEEVGIEPGQELQDLERAILNRDPVLLLPTPAVVASPKATVTPRRTADPAIPRLLPAGIADFTSREDTVAEIKQVLADGDDVALRIVAISGMGGVGKSSLAIRAAHELSDTFVDGHLYADLRPTGADEDTAALLARFLRALGVAGSAIPDGLAERVEMYRSKVFGKRLLVVLDDVTSEPQIRPLLPGSPTCAVIVTSRTRLSELSGAHRVDLDLFDEEQSLRMLSRIVGSERIDAEPEHARELVNFCGRLPLALRIAGARLASRPHWRVVSLTRRLRSEAHRLDELTHRGLVLRTNIGLTYRSLSRSAQQLFRRFALVQAPDFPGWAAAALLDTDLFEAEDILETLVDAQMLDTVLYPGEQLPRYRFHDLIRVYAAEQLLAVESAQEREDALGRLLGAWLALAEQAHRMEYGGDFTVLHGDAPRWTPPGEAEIIDNVVTWWETERRSLVAAIKQAAAAGLDEVSWDLAHTAVTLFETKGYFDDWRETTQLALELVERKGNDRGRAAMLYSLGTLHMSQQRLDEADACFTTALGLFDAVGDVHGRAMALRNMAYVDRMSGRLDRIRAKYTESLELMRSVGDRVGEAHVLCNLARIHVDDGDLDGARERLELALRISQQVRCLRMEAQVLKQFSTLYGHTEDFELARQMLHRVLRIVRDVGDWIGEAHALYSLGLVRHGEGRLDLAETTLQHALTASRRAAQEKLETEVVHALERLAAAMSDRPEAITAAQGT